MRRILLSGLIVSIALFLGRLSGFFREVFVANLFGASAYSDLVIVFLTIPDVLVNLLVGGALGMVLIPELNRLNEKDGNALYIQVLLFCIILFTFLSLMLSVFSVQILNFFAPGIEKDFSNNAANFLGISLLAIPLTVVSGITTAYLNHKGKFFIPAMGTLIFNVVIIIFLIAATKRDHTHFFYYLSIGITTAALIRWICFLLNEKKPLKFSNFFSKNLLSIELGKRYLQCVIASGLLFLIPVFMRSLASGNGPGSLSIVNYTLKLIEFPLAVFLTVFSIVFLPRLSTLQARGDLSSFNKVFWSVLMILFFISTTIFFVINYFPVYMTSIVYGWGGLEEYAITSIAELVAIAVYSLVFQSIISFLISSHAAKADTFSPFIISVIGVIIFIALTYNSDISLKELFYIMNCCYFLVMIFLLLSMRYIHKVTNEAFNISKLFVMLFILLVTGCLLYFISSYDFSIIEVFLISLFICVSSFLAWLISDRDLRVLVKSHE